MSIKDIFPNAAQLDTMNDTLVSIAESIGAYQIPETWAAIQRRVRGGVIGRILSVGEQVTVEHSSMVTASVEGEGITAAAVDKDAFLAAAGTGKDTYVYAYDGANWQYEDTAVTLATYGITPTGTPASGDTITVHRTATAYDYDVDSIDIEQPVDPAREHCLSIGMHDIYSLLNFDVPMFLWPVTAESLASIGVSGTELPAGTYKITVDHGAYGGGTTQDGTFQFTTTQPVPIGGGIRHTVLGVYQSNSDYSKEKLLTGTFVTYGADTYTVIEQGLATTEGTDGTGLGTATARNPQYKVGDYINFTERQGHGSNRLSWCYMFQLLNSDDATFRWKRKSIWSRNLNIQPEGFLHSLDPELRAVIGKVRRRVALSIMDGYGYEDIEAYCFPYSMLDLYGQANNSIYEGPVDTSGEVTHKTYLPLWQGAAQADKIKRQAGTARHWWLASPNPSNCYERYVNTSGALNYSTPSVSYGVVPRLFII